MVWRSGLQSSSGSIGVKGSRVEGFRLLLPPCAPRPACAKGAHQHVEVGFYERRLEEARYLAGLIPVMWLPPKCCSVARLDMVCYHVLVVRVGFPYMLP